MQIRFITRLARRQDLVDALVQELGAPARFAFDLQSGIGAWHLQTAIEVLEDYEFDRPASDRTFIRYEPVGNTIVHKLSEIASPGRTSRGLQ